GHLTGDHVIHELARRTLARLDRFEVLCRYEGSQFLLLLPEVDVEGAASHGDELRRAISVEAVQSDGDLVVVTLSGGVASLASESDAPSFIRSVQEAVARAKKAGRNQFAR
ncbi:MAG TPA: diguanylate cyclase, partial [Pseudomonadota bacterium]|nr:diguanylate cyclase [Pseudomonadota bacterium]